jgi:hypothetical protein
MTNRFRLDLLADKYFMAPSPHDDGVVVAVIDDKHYLVRSEASADGRPEALAVVALSDMVRVGTVGEEDEAPNLPFLAP